MRWLRFPRILGIVVCLYLIGMSVVFGSLSTQNYRFVRGAQATTGTVIALLPTPTAGSSRTPVNRPGRLVPTAPRVRYTVDGRTYEYVAAHGQYRQPLHVGDHVTVLYDPRNPARARLHGEGSVLVPMITSGFATCAVAVAVLLFLTRNVGVVPRSRRTAGDAVELEDRPADSSSTRPIPHPDQPVGERTGRTPKP